MKRLFKIALSVVLASLLAFSLGGCVNPNNAQDKAGLKYATNKDGEYVIYQYAVEEGVSVLDIEQAVRLDSKDENAKVVEIKPNAFKNVDSLEKIIVPSTVVKIGKGAFTNVKNLKELTLPFVGSLLKADAYYDQTLSSADKAIDAEKTFAYIFGNDEYDGGTAVSIMAPADQTTTAYYIPCTLEKITINPNANYEIPMYSFYGFSFEMEIVLGENVVAIGEGAFKNCTKIYDFTISTSIQKIYKDAFNGCSNLETINYLGDATDWANIEILTGAFENTNKYFKVLDNLGAEISIAE